jgi:hypothetical protein
LRQGEIHRRVTRDKRVPRFGWNRCVISNEVAFVPGPDAVDDLRERLRGIVPRTTA